MNAIEFDHVTRRFHDRVAVDDLTLAIPEGEMFGFFGVNGAGKTPIVNMLCGLIRPTSGDIRVLGNSVKRHPRRLKSHVGVSPHEVSLAPNMTVEENLRMICGVNGMRPAEAGAMIRRLMEQFDLIPQANRRAADLSGGWKRRLSIAMALVQDPEVLILDEPTVGLDILAQQELWQIILKLKGTITIILSSHDPQEAQLLCDRIGILSHGHLMAEGTVDELLSEASAATFEDAFFALCGESISRGKLD